MTHFNPLEAAHKVLLDTRIADPDQIAELVFQATPKRLMAHAYRSLLRGVAREAIRLANMSAGEENDVAPQPSSRLRAIRAQHLAELDQRVFANGEWKLLGDCTIPDFLDLAAQRRQIAAKNTAKAEQYEKIAARMAEYGAETYRELEGAAA